MNTYSHRFCLTFVLLAGVIVASESTADAERYKTEAEYLARLAELGLAAVSIDCFRKRHVVG